ncbi:9607_t:CDS:2, partial [Funneliformis caledonium]
AVCNGRELNLKNDIFIVIEACGTSINTGDPVPFNSTIGFKHQAKEEGILHSHSINIPDSKHQQVTIWSGRDGNDDWVIRRYGSKDDAGYFSNGEIISLTH